MTSFSMWRTLSGFGVDTLPHLPDLFELALAEVGPGGEVRSVNLRGSAEWGWKADEPLPLELLAALDTPHDDARVRTLQAIDRRLIAVRMEGNGGWLLLGRCDEPADAPVSKTPPPSSFKSLIEKIPVLVLRMQPDATVHYVNAEAERLTGYMPEEILGRAFWLETVHTEDRWKLTEALRRVRAGQDATAGVRFLTKQQTLRFAEMHFFPVGEGAAQEIEGVVFDVTAQSEIEEALFQSEALYRTFLEQSPLGMLHLDAEGAVTFESHQFRQIVGEAVDDAWIGRTIDHIPGLDEAVKREVKTMLEEGAALHARPADFRRGADASVRHLMIHGSPIRQPGGAIVGGVLMVEDVTEERQRDEELKLRNRYDRAEAALREAALATTDEAAFLREAARILGEHTGADRLRLLTPADGNWTASAAWTRPGHPAPAALHLDEEDLDLLRATPNALHLRRIDAVPREQALLDRTEAREALWLPLREADSPGGFLLFEHNRTTQDAWPRTAQQLIEGLVRLFETLWAWLQAGNRYRLTVATIDDCLFNFSFDEDGTRHYQFITPQVEALTGRTPEVVLANGTFHWIGGLVYAEDRARVRLHDEVLRDGQESRLTYRIVCPDGALRWLREHGTPRRNAADTVTVSGILTDVTEQKHAEETLLRAKEHAESANRLKSAFINMMSHEIRSPLGAVRGFAELLKQELAEVETEGGKALPPQLAEFTDAIHDNTQRLLTLFNDLFDLYNLEVGSFQVQRVAVPLHEVIQRATGKIAGALALKGLDLHFDLCAEPTVALGDPQRIEQVLDQLLANAVKFTDEGHLTVRTGRKEGQVTVEVEDTGVGMAPEYLEQLFTPFLQEDSRLNRRFGGTGLGLTLTRGLLDQMEGHIEVQSEKGVGSTFRVLLLAN